MKRFILKILAFALIPIGFYIYFIFAIPVPDDLYFIEYNKKMELLERVPSPRIIFVGGSSLAFGLDSKRIQDSLKLPVINSALHAGIGLKFILDDAASYFRKGDIVFITPEYTHFDGGAYGESLTLPILLKATKWKKLNLLNKKQWYIFLKGIPDLRKYAKMPKEGYKASNFNEFGDEVFHWTIPDLPIPPSSYACNPLDEDFFMYFIEKVNEIEKMGCTVIISPCACRESLYNAYKNIDKIEKRLAELKRPFNTPARKHALDDSCAFDTDFHLNKKGVDIFTGMIIEELKEELGK